MIHLFGRIFGILLLIIPCFDGHFPLTRSTIITNQAVFTTENLPRTREKRHELDQVMSKLSGLEAQMTSLEHSVALLYRSLWSSDPFDPLGPGSHHHHHYYYPVNQYFLPHIPVPNQPTSGPRPRAPSDTVETKPANEVSNESKLIAPVEDMIMATCRIRANRHITLLNQQDVTGLIRLWQRRNKPHSPLYMQVRLKGFKVNTDNETTNCENGTLNETETTTTANYVRFGMHVHESGDLSRDCQSTGNHFNPQSTTHGGPNDIVKHTGDLGNISCDGRGVATENLVFNHLSLVGENSILNRAIVIRDQPDDYGKNQKVLATPGVRIACCVIRELVDTNNFGDFISDSSSS